MLKGIDVIEIPGWKRGQEFDPNHLALKNMIFDVLISYPDPTYWVKWQLGKLTPKLTWNTNHENLYQKFGLKENQTYIGIQPFAETNYGLWRNWTLKRWEEFIDLCSEKGYKVLLFGYGNTPKFSQKNIVDLRGKTDLFEILSIIKNRCRAVVLPDSGILSMTYFLNTDFPIKVISLFGQKNHGILKQNVPSPNGLLEHVSIVSPKRDLSLVTAKEVFFHV